MRNLRSSLIRLAYYNPDLRADLLPLLKTGSDSEVINQLRSNPRTFSGKPEDLKEALEALGGSLDLDHVGYVHLKASNKYTTDSQELAQQMHEVYSTYLVHSLPNNPEEGRVYLTDLSPVTKKGKNYVITMTGSIAMRGYKTTLPSGASYEQLPTLSGLEFDLDYVTPAKPFSFESRAARGTLKQGGTLNWLLENGIKELAADHLAKPLVRRTLAGTGSCAVCFQNVKLRGDYLARHGYTRPSDGSIYGQCEGTNFPPFEVSPEGTKAVLKALNEDLISKQQYLQQLQNDEISQINTKRGPVMVSSPQWQSVFNTEVSMAAIEIRRLEREISHYEKLIQNWEPRPLPVEGQAEINWYFAGVR